MERPKPRLSVVAVAHGGAATHDVITGCFRCQTRADWELMIIHDGPIDDPLVEEAHARIHRGDRRIEAVCTTERYNDWGHSLRRIALRSPLSDVLTGEYLLLTNFDNYYCPTFVADMLEAADTAKGPTLVYCDMLHNRRYTPGLRYKPFATSLEYCKVDIGAVIVKTEVAKAVGWRSLKENSDWTFIHDVMATPGFFWNNVPRTLVVHN